MIQNSEKIRRYGYKVSKDTSYIHIYENGDLLVEKKKYKSDKYDIEINRFISLKSSDTTYFINNKVVKDISYDGNMKTVEITEYDINGNPKRQEIKSYIKNNN